jgi:starch phosphorylase
VEAEALYDLLERAVIPEFYERRDGGPPVAWIRRMRESMARLTPQFSANRAVREYTERHYLPAAAAYRARAAGGGTLGRTIADWQRGLDQHWHSVRFGGVRMNPGPDGTEIEIEVYLNGLDPNSVRVELYADADNDQDRVVDMRRVRTAPDPSSPHLYHATPSARRPIGDYTARVVPARADVGVPLECARIAWQR